MKKVTWGELLLGGKEHKRQMERIKKIHCCDCQRPIGSWECTEDIKNKHHLEKLEVGKTYHMNEDNDCIFYKRKWWKIWRER